MSKVFRAMRIRGNNWGCLLHKPFDIILVSAHLQSDHTLRETKSCNLRSAWLLPLSIETSVKTRDLQTNFSIVYGDHIQYRWKIRNILEVVGKLSPLDVQVLQDILEIISFRTPT